MFNIDINKQVNPEIDGVGGDKTILPAISFIVENESQWRHVFGNNKLYDQKVNNISTLIELMDNDVNETVNTEIKEFLNYDDDDKPKTEYSLFINIDDLGIDNVGFINLVKSNENLQISSDFSVKYRTAASASSISNREPYFSKNTSEWKELDKIILNLNNPTKNLNVELINKQELLIKSDNLIVPNIEDTDIKYKHCIKDDTLLNSFLYELPETGFIFEKINMNTNKNIEFKDGSKLFYLKKGIPYNIKLKDNNNEYYLSSRKWYPCQAMDPELKELSKKCPAQKRDLRNDGAYITDTHTWFLQKSGENLKFTSDNDIILYLSNDNEHKVIWENNMKGEIIRKRGHRFIATTHDWDTAVASRYLVGYLS